MKSFRHDGLFRGCKQIHNVTHSLIVSAVRLNNRLLKRESACTNTILLDGSDILP